MLGVVRLSDVIEMLAQEVDRLEPARTSGADAARLVVLFDRAERLAAAGKALMASRAVQCRQWATDGAHSPQEWLSQVSGVALSAAQRTLDTAEQMLCQPELADALRSGEISAAQAGEISSAVAANPTATPRLIEEAQTQGFKGLKKACRAAKLAAASSREDDEAMARRQRESRYLRTWSEADGTGRIDARLDPISFTRFTSLLHPFEEQVFSQARKAGTREPTERYRADALLVMAETAAGARAATSTSAASATIPSTGSDGPAADDASPDEHAPGGATAGGAPKTRAPSKVIVVVDRNALLRGHARDGEICEIKGFGPVPVAVARQIMEDSFLAAVVADGVDIRSVLHLGRYPTEMQKTALEVRDPACVVPRCGRTDRLEGHHVPEFEVSRHTVLDELAMLCPAHHDDVTYHGATLLAGAEGWRWTPPPPHGEFEGPPQGVDPCAGPFDDPPDPGP